MPESFLSSGKFSGVLAARRQERKEKHIPVIPSRSLRLWPKKIFLPVLRVLRG
jgi:hypothetical protein